MAFEVEVNTLDNSALHLEYHEVPWDSEMLGQPVAQLRAVTVREPRAAASAFAAYLDWKKQHEIGFATAKISQSLVREILLVQRFGYRFVELNYRPEIALDHISSLGDQELEFIEAEPSDEYELTEMASRTFRDTRFHLDPVFGEDVGNRRYGEWMQNAFRLPHQQVVKCVQDGSTLAFFVQENPVPDQVFWSLVGLAPGLQGKGLGKKIWLAIMRWHRERGVRKISTSISSLNGPALNLYARLGFRFPEPQATFHWHRRWQADE